MIKSIPSYVIYIFSKDLKRGHPAHVRSLYDEILILNYNRDD